MYICMWILSVLFKLLHCQKIGDKTYHFYFAFEECDGFTWIISMILLIVIIFIFSMIFIKIKKNDSDPNIVNHVNMMKINLLNVKIKP